MARLYSNENFPLKVVQALRTLGHDVLTSFEAGNANQAIPDDEVLRYAFENQRILLTLNRRDFIKLHKQGQPHAGILVCSQDPDVCGQAEKIDKALQQTDRYENILIRVYLSAP